MYSEIISLKSDFSKFSIRISEPVDNIRKDLFFVFVSINHKTWKVLIDDEYQDFSKDNKLFNWFLILNSLQLFEETDDFLDWCKQFNAGKTDDNQLEYYKTLPITFNEIKNELGVIDSYISPYQYNLRTGVIQALKNNKTRGDEGN